MATRRNMTEANLANIERVRARYNWTLAEFGEALGLSPSGYSSMARQGRASQTVALAAEAIARRQAPAGASAPALQFLLQVSTDGRGSAQLIPLTECQTMSLNGTTYLLVPTGPGLGQAKANGPVASPHTSKETTQ